MDLLKKTRGATGGRLSAGPGLGGRGMSSFSHANSKPRQAGSAPAGRGVQFRLPGVGGDGQGPVSAQRGGGLAWACML